MYIEMIVKSCKNQFPKKIVIGYNIIRFVYCWRNILGSDNNRNIGLSEIIRMLENNVTFTQAADSVLECITDSMDVCDAVVMQIDRKVTLCM